MSDRLPSATHLPMLVHNLRTAADWIEDHGAQVLLASTVRDTPPIDERRAAGSALAQLEDLGGDGSGGAPRSKTEAEALANDWLAEKQLELRRLLAWLETNAADTKAAIHEILKRVDPALCAPDRTELLTMSCAETGGRDRPGCEDPAEPGCEGRCRPCHEWRTGWRAAHNGEPAPPVPQAVIDARVAERNAPIAPKRVRVSGPLAGEVA